MREYKFRAWDKGRKTMRYQDKEYFYIALRKSCKGNEFIKESAALVDNFFTPEQGTLMQFTGLHDKNGKEIYELMELDNQYRVIWDDCSFYLQDIKTNEIIGLLSNSLRRANEREITREYSPL